VLTIVHVAVAIITIIANITVITPIVIATLVLALLHVIIFSFYHFPVVRFQLVLNGCFVSFVVEGTTIHGTAL